MAKTFKRLDPDSAAVAVTTGNKHNMVAIAFFGAVLYRPQDKEKVAKLLENAARMVRET